MDEYISKEDAIKAILAMYEYEYPTASGAFDTFATKEVPQVIRNLPPADVKPVERGAWRLLSHNGDGTSDYECTACYGIMSDVPDDDEHELCSFCPNCGADMRPR